MNIVGAAIVNSPQMPKAFILAQWLPMSCSCATQSLRLWVPVLAWCWHAGHYTGQEKSDKRLKDGRKVPRKGMHLSCKFSHDGPTLSNSLRILSFDSKSSEQAWVKFSTSKFKSFELGITAVVRCHMNWRTSPLTKDRHSGTATTNVHLKSKNQLERRINFAILFPLLLAESPSLISLSLPRWFDIQKAWMNWDMLFLAVRSMSQTWSMPRHTTFGCLAVQLEAVQVFQLVFLVTGVPSCPTFQLHCSGQHQDVDSTPIFQNFWDILRISK